MFSDRVWFFAYVMCGGYSCRASCHPFFFFFFLFQEVSETGILVELFSSSLLVMALKMCSFFYSRKYTRLMMELE